MAAKIEKTNLPGSGRGGVLPETVRPVDQTAEQKQAERESMGRLAERIDRELASILTPHWRGALRQLRDALAVAAENRSAREMG